VKLIKNGVIKGKSFLEFVHDLLEVNFKLTIRCDLNSKGKLGINFK
jgi:hypothetical protein